MMNKAWITGITVASVAGTGGAAYATMQANTQHNSAAAEAPQSTAEITTTTAGAQAYEFQAGPAGVVHLTADNGVLRVDSALPSVGWTLLDYTSPAAHVEVRLTDGTQIVTFSGDIVNGKVTGSLASSPAPTVPTTEPATTAPVATPAPQPAVPPQQLAPAGQTPGATHTSAPSGSHTASGGDDSNEHESDDSHESEHEGGGSDD
jgi:hypothetical protein